MSRLRYSVSDNIPVLALNRLAEIDLPPTCGPHAPLLGSSRLRPRRRPSPPLPSSPNHHRPPRFLLLLLDELRVRPIEERGRPEANGEGRAGEAPVHDQEVALVRPHRPRAVAGRGQQHRRRGPRGVSFHGADEVPKGLHAVYVGKSRRRYLIAEELVGHPLFQTLVDRTGSGGGAGEAGCTVVGCEVVLFEHVLWMLENADPPPESLDELVEYYAC